jgi:hypothetical protein
MHVWNEMILGQHEQKFLTILGRRTFATQHTKLRLYTVFIMPAVAKKQTRTDKLNAADAMAMAVAVHRRNNEARKKAARNTEHPENGAPAAAPAQQQQKQKRKRPVVTAKENGTDQLNEAKKVARKKAARNIMEHPEHGAPAAAPAQKKIQKKNTKDDEKNQQKNHGHGNGDSGGRSWPNNQQTTN